MYVEEYFDSGIQTIRINKSVDDRGIFRKLINSDIQFAKIEEVSIVNNETSGVLRGLHFQKAPNAESKVVIVLDGEIFDVIVDLNSLTSSSPSVYTFWLGEEHDIQGLVIPSNFAHGYLSTSNASSILYAMDKPYKPESASGIRWNDPALKISWPTLEMKISERDKSWPTLEYGVSI